MRERRARIYTDDHEGTTLFFLTSLPFVSGAGRRQADYLAGCLMHDAGAGRPFPRTSDWNNMLKVGCRLVCTHNHTPHPHVHE